MRSEAHALLSACFQNGDEASSSPRPSPPGEEKEKSLSRERFWSAMRGAATRSDIRRRSVRPFGFRISGFGFRILGLALLLLSLGSTLAAPLPQPKDPMPLPTPIDPVEGRKQAAELVANLLAQRPLLASTNTGMVRIRDSNGKRRALPAKFEILVTPTNVSTIYEAAASEGHPELRLVIVRANGQPNHYFLSERTSAAASKPRELAGAELMTPFAGSDFWVGDLGLDFLHWPQQRVVQKEMRQHVFCAVLESINPNPVPGGYAKVLSWIGISHPDETVLVCAEAYNSKGKRLKEFTPEDLEKIDGAYQLRSMRMANYETDSSTIIEFNLKTDSR
jgi:hypothetical protein